MIRWSSKLATGFLQTLYVFKYSFVQRACMSQFRPIQFLFPDSILKCDFLASSMMLLWKDRQRQWHNTPWQKFVFILALAGDQRPFSSSPFTLTHFQIGFLSVVEAPDILYNETSNDTIVPEGYDVNLRCEARGFPEPTVTWRREGGALIALRDNDDAGKTIRGEWQVDVPKQIHVVDLSKI